MLNRNMKSLEEAGIPLRFSPEDGPEFFTRCGWRPVDARSIVHTSARLKRAPFLLSLIARVTSPAFTPRQPWSAVCLFEKA
jgi:hypothetical protein